MCAVLFAVQPSYCYSKSSVFAARSSLLPHLELEMGTSGDGSSLLLYINMDPRLSLVRGLVFRDRMMCFVISSATRGVVSSLLLYGDVRLSLARVCLPVGVPPVSPGPLLLQHGD